MCEFSYYKEEEKNEYYPQLYCRLRNDFCLYRKRCEDRQKFIIIEDLWRNCNIMDAYNKNKEIPNGANRVVSYYNKKGKVKLFVDVNGNNIVIDSPNNEPLDYVFLKKDGEKYLAFLEKPQDIKKSKSKDNAKKRN